MSSFKAIQAAEAAQRLASLFSIALLMLANLAQFVAAVQTLASEDALLLERASNNRDEATFAGSESSNQWSEFGHLGQPIELRALEDSEHDGEPMEQQLEQQDQTGEDYNESVASESAAADVGERFRRDTWASMFSCPVKANSECSGSSCKFKLYFYSPLSGKEVELSYANSSTGGANSWFNSVRLGSVDWQKLGSRVSNWVDRMANRMARGRNTQRDEDDKESGESVGRRFARLAPPFSGGQRRASGSGRSKLSGWSREDLAAMMKAGFDLDKPSLLYSHGYTEGPESDWLVLLRERYSELMSKNVIPFNLLIFDWSSVALNVYTSTAAKAPFIGESILGGFLAELALSYKYNMDKMHLIGYSLSSHIVGMAGKAMADLGKPVGQITALDPTGVCFAPNSVFSNKYALKRTHAKLVVARHYDIGMAGARGPIGGLDIYVDGGRNSLFDGRTLDSSSDNNDGRYSSIEDFMMRIQNRITKHSLASHHEVDEFDESCQEIAYECRSYEAFLDGECADCGKDNEKCYMISNFGYLLLQSERAISASKLRPQLTTTAANNGETGEEETTKDDNLSSNQRVYKMGGKFYLNTNQRSPFCLHHYQLVWKLKPAAGQLVRALLKSGDVHLKLESRTIARPMRQSQLDPNKFTTLITQPQRFKHWNDISVGLEIKLNKDLLGDLFAALDHLEVNYMSHVLPDERQNASCKFCPETNSIGDNILVQCSTD